MFERHIKSIDLSKSKLPETVSTESHSNKERKWFGVRKSVHKIIRPTKSIDLSLKSIRDSSDSDKME